MFESIESNVTGIPFYICFLRQSQPVPHMDRIYSRFWLHTMHSQSRILRNAIISISSFWNKDGSVEYGVTLQKPHLPVVCMAMAG